MRATRSTFDAGQPLGGANCDIVDDYRTITDAVVQAKDKYDQLVRGAQELKTTLERKEAELDRVTALREQQLSQHKAALDSARRRSARLRECKDEIASLRRRNRHLEGDLNIMRESLERVKHLTCDVCTDGVKNVVTRCGHGYCAGCLNQWLQSGERSCPTCRRIVRPGRDVWPVYLGGDDCHPEVVVLDSDSE